MNLIDCNMLKHVPQRTYGGRTGSKIAVLYDNEVYMLKCAESIKGRDFKNVVISYANDCVSEYIGSHVYSIVGIPVHDTLLGVYSGKQCVLCKDVAYPNNIIEFRQLRNTIMSDNITQDSSGMSNNIEDILETIEMADYIQKDLTLKRFWEMFVVDSVIGNPDRNNGNWGYLTTDEYFYVLAPVYDCGGCLNKWKSDEQIVSMSESQKHSIALDYTVNFYKDGKIINPFQYMKKNTDNIFIKSAINLVLNVDRVKIWNMLDELVPIISEQRKCFYRYLIDTRLNMLSTVYENKSSKVSSLLKLAEGD